MSLAYSVSFIDEFVTEATDWEILGDKIRYGEFQILKSSLRSLNLYKEMSVSYHV